MDYHNIKFSGSTTGCLGTLILRHQFILYDQFGFPHAFTALCADFAATAYLAEITGTLTDGFPQLMVRYIFAQADVHDRSRSGD